MNNEQGSKINNNCENAETRNDVSFEGISGGSLVGIKKSKCINWECKECAKKSVDPFYVGGIHKEECKYRGIVGCKVCKHYVKGIRCDFANSGDT